MKRQGIELQLRQQPQQPKSIYYSYKPPLVLIDDTTFKLTSNNLLNFQGNSNKI